MVDKHEQAREALRPFFDHLEALPFVQRVDVDEMETAEGRRLLDGLLRIETPGRPYLLFFELKRTNLAYTTADGVIAQAKRHPEHPWILFAPYVPEPMGAYLAGEGINFVDETGNCRLELGAEHVARIEGRKRARHTIAKWHTGPAGFEVMFALLANADLLNAPVREIAANLGAGKSAVARAIRQLAHQGLITKNKPRRILRRKELLDRWLAGYETVVRPRQVVGRYKTLETDLPRLEERIEHLLEEAETTWGWSGGAAAMRLTGYFRGANTVVAVERVPGDFFRQLRALPQDDGNLTVLEATGDLAFEGAAPHTVHPLLVFAELRVARDQRARNAAEEVRKRYLEYLE
jgi:hypothetical protein